MVSFMQSAELALEWSGQVGAGFAHAFAPGVAGAAGPLYSDAFRFRRSVAGVWSQESLGFYAAQKAKGRELEPSKGQDVNQLAGDMVVARDGTIALAYYSRTNTDRPTMEQLLEACGTAESLAAATSSGDDCGGRAIFDAASRAEAASKAETAAPVPLVAVGSSSEAAQDDYGHAVVAGVGALLGALAGALLAVAAGMGST